MRISGAYLPDDESATEAGVRRALERLGLPAAAARLWLSSATGRLDRAAEWALDYDPELELATFEVLLDGRLVFGIDDLLPHGRHDAPVD